MEYENKISTEMIYLFYLTKNRNSYRPMFFSELTQKQKR